MKFPLISHEEFHSFSSPQLQSLPKERNGTCSVRVHFTQGESVGWGGGEPIERREAVQQVCRGAGGESGGVGAHHQHHTVRLGPSPALISDRAETTHRIDNNLTPHRHLQVVQGLDFSIAPLDEKSRYDRCSSHH